MEQNRYYKGTYLSTNLWIDLEFSINKNKKIKMFTIVCASHNFPELGPKNEITIGQNFQPTLLNYHFQLFF